MATTAMTTDSAARDITNGVAIVTGAGSGVGAATCRLLAAAGMQVVLVGRSEDKLAQIKSALREDGIGDNARPAICDVGDVGDSAFCDDLVRRTVQRHGGLDIVVNNAGVMRRGAAADTSDEDWAQVMRTNVDGVFYMSRAAVRAMSEKGGAIVNVSSTCGLVGAAGLAAYCTSKGAVVQLTRAMALECAPQRITVNAVCPGAIEAPMLFSAHQDGSDAEAVRERNKAAIPLKQLASAEEVARAIVYLAREPHITGTMLSVDGGYTAG